MSNINRTRILAAACAIALLFVVAVGVDAQSNRPIGEDDIVTCIHKEDGVLIAPLAQLQEVEEMFPGEPIEVVPMGAVLDTLPPARPGYTVHFDGAEPDMGVVLSLGQHGYVHSFFVAPLLPSSESAVEFTD